MADPPDNPPVWWRRIDGPDGPEWEWRTEEQVRKTLGISEKEGQVALEKLEKLRSQLDAIGAVDVDVSVKKQEPLRGVSALITIVTVLLIVCNSKGWITFTTEEQTAILGALAILGNEVARMHVTAPPKS